MSRVIVLLPSPDRLQVANCHKYVTRTERRYDDIYTLTTCVGMCKEASKMLVIGHGNVGGFQTSTPKAVADAIVASGFPLWTGCEVAFDTCYAGKVGTGTGLSCLDEVRKKLPWCVLILTGSTGCTVTIGGDVNDKRLVVDDAKKQDASKDQARLAGPTGHNVALNDAFPSWNENATSAQIKRWAKEEYDKLKDFASDLRAALKGNKPTDSKLDTSSGRKTWTLI